MALAIRRENGRLEILSDIADVVRKTAAITSQELLPANVNRLGGYIQNGSTAMLWIRYGTGAASGTTYTTPIKPGGLYEIPTAPLFVGAIQGIWSAANGAALVTELT